jgi:hypothetical protein
MANRSELIRRITTLRDTQSTVVLGAARVAEGQNRAF